MSDDSKYVLDREFDAPREMVWKAWTDPELLARWYGPNIETVIHAFDLKPGGVWLNEMKMNAMSDYSRMDFKEVIAPEKLAWCHTSTDEKWSEIANPMMPDWPRKILTTVTFEDQGNKTKVRLVWEPFEASESEVACFNAAVSRMGGGWEAGYKIIDAILAELANT